MIEAINIYYGRAAIPVGAYYGDDIGDPVDKMLAESLVSQKPGTSQAFADYLNILIAQACA